MAFSSIEGLERSRKSTSGKSTGMRIAEILREPAGNQAYYRRREVGDVKRHTMRRLDSFIDAIAGKRLTYERLIAKVGA